jgi:hypothetical protein
VYRFVRFDGKTVRYMEVNGELVNYQNVMNQRNKEFSIVVTFVPSGAMNQEQYVFLAEEFSFEPVASDNASGTSFNCDKELVISRPDSSILREFSIFRSGILYFRDTSGNSYGVGDADIPARVCLSPQLNSARLTMKCTMLKPPVL